MLGGWFAKGTPEEGSPLYLPELETPTTRQQYEDLAGRTLEVLLRLEREDEDYGWVPIDVAEEDVELWEKPDKTGFSCIKTGGVIPVNAKNFFEWICPQPIEERQRWDGDLNEYRVIEEISDNIDVIYRSYNTPAYGVAPREFVALNAKCKLPDGAYISYGKSINHKDGKYVSKYVRGNALVSGLIVRPIEGERNKCFVWRIAQLDPRGMIPGWVISLGKKRAASGFAKLREIATKEVKPLSIQEEEEQQQIQVENEDIQVEQVIEQVQIVEERREVSSSGHSILFEQQTSAILTNIQMLISNVQLEIRSYHSSLKETKESLQNSFGNQLAFLQNQVLHHQNRRINLSNLGWDVILFIIAWPFVFQLLWNYFRKNLLKK